MGWFGSDKKKKENDYGTSFPGLAHVKGLNIPAYSECSARLDQDELIIIYMGTEMHLPYSQIISTDCDINSEDKIVSEESSVVRGLVGAATMGVAGAVIGSVPKIKTERETTTYTTVCYESSDGTVRQFMVKDMVPSDKYPAGQLYKALRRRITPREMPIKHINL